MFLYVSIIYMAIRISHLPCIFTPLTYLGVPQWRSLIHSAPHHSTQQRTRTQSIHSPYSDYFPTLLEDIFWWLPSGQFPLCFHRLIILIDAIFSLFCSRTWKLNLFWQLVKNLVPKFLFIYFFGWKVHFGKIDHSPARNHFLLFFVLPRF